MLLYALDGETGISTEVDNLGDCDVFSIPFLVPATVNVDDIQPELMSTKFPYVLNFPPIVDYNNVIIGFDRPINISGASMYANLDTLNEKYNFTLAIKRCMISPAFGESVGNIGFIVAYNPYVKQYVSFCALETDIEVYDDVIKQYAPWNNNVIIPQE